MPGGLLGSLKRAQDKHREATKEEVNYQKQKIAYEQAEGFKPILHTAKHEESKTNEIKTTNDVKTTKDIIDNTEIGMGYKNDNTMYGLTITPSTKPLQGPFGSYVTYQNPDSNFASSFDVGYAPMSKDFAVSLKFKWDLNVQVKYDNNFLNSSIIDKCSSSNFTNLLNLTSNMDKDSVNNLVSIIENTEISKQEKVLDLFSQFDQNDIREILGSYDVQDIVDTMIG